MVVDSLATLIPCIQMLPNVSGEKDVLVADQTNPDGDLQAPSTK